MKTAVSKRGQTAIPASLRRKYHISKESYLEWIDTGEEIRVVPVPKNVLATLRGIAKGEGLREKLLRERSIDAARE